MLLVPAEYLSVALQRPVYHTGADRQLDWRTMRMRETREANGRASFEVLTWGLSSLRFGRCRPASDAEIVTDLGLENLPMQASLRGVTNVV